MCRAWYVANEVACCSRLHGGTGSEATRVTMFQPVEPSTLYLHSLSFGRFVVLVVFGDGGSGGVLVL